MELQQALLLTLIGMGMTFAAIGLLVVGMYVMTALLKDKADVKDLETDDFEDLDLPVADVSWEKPSDNSAHIAAAAAVATMLAEQQGKAQAAAAAVAIALTKQATASSQPTASLSTWNATIRAQRLAQRQYHDSRRRH